MKRKIEVNCDTKLAIPLDELIGIQGALKMMPLESYQKFRRVVLKKGITFAFHVWKDTAKLKGKKVVKWYIVDGHGRKALLTKLRDDEDYTIPAIPCVEVKAKSLQEAKDLVLDSSSQYHQATKEGMFEFLSAGMGLTKAQIRARIAEIEVPHIDVPEFLMEFIDEPAATEEGGTGKTVSFDAYKNASVKQIVLYFAKDDYEKAIKALDEYVETHGLEDYSQAIWKRFQIN